MTTRARRRMTGISLDQDSFNKLVELAGVDRRPRSAEIGWLIQQEYTRRTQRAVPRSAPRRAAQVHIQADESTSDHDPGDRLHPV